ncbi:MAG: TraR/DksA family transcriptional regulator [Pseudomonadota bacterium]
MGDMNIDALRRKLEARHAELLADEAATAGDRAPVELDQQSVGRLSRMDALQVQAMAEAQADRRRAELRRIDEAMARLEADEYGYCISCGEEIAPKRLELDPAAAVCVRCAGGSK